MDHESKLDAAVVLSVAVAMTATAFVWALFVF
jgi:hypothetical protein